MKGFDLNAMGVSEMTEMEMKNTEGGFWTWLALLGCALIAWFGMGYHQY